MPEIRKIAITGPESTGKSLLAERLANHYQTKWVPEFARSYIDELKRPYVAGDILAIARGQLDLEQEILKQASNYLFCDTELIVTKIWSEVKYGYCDPWILANIEKNHYHLFLLCDIDLPWVEDPQREHPHLRNKLFDLYFRELTTRNFPFRVVSGTGESRLENAVRLISEFNDLLPCKS
jgi:NadR type nicotinamide-nucleotide adenylyltransferase